MKLWEGIMQGFCVLFWITLAAGYRVPNPSITHHSPFESFQYVYKNGKENATRLYEDVLFGLLDNTRWFYAPFMRDLLTNGTGPSVNVSDQCKSHVLRIMDDVPAPYTVRCKSFGILIFFMFPCAIFPVCWETVLIAGKKEAL